MASSYVGKHGSMAHQWELRSPDGGMLGLEFARSVMEPADVVLVHSAPSRLDVTVIDEQRRVVAAADGLEAGGSSPMSRLRIAGGELFRENVWPTEADHGLPVILPGGEVGILLEWWNADDESEWRWRVEFSNHA